MNNILPSQLYITEASKSKKKTDEEMSIPDPQTAKLADIIDKNDKITAKSDGK